MVDNNYGLPDPEDLKIEQEKAEKQRRVKELSDLVDKFEDALKEAEIFADKHSLTFSIYPQYGMGGYYKNGEWNASSEGC